MNNVKVKPQMAYVAPPRPVVRTEPAAPTVFWKDLSVIGCVVSGLLLSAMIFALLDPSSGIPKVREVMRFQSQLEGEIEQLRAENAQVLNAIQAMQTDPFWQEKIAREELNMALPGEIVYKFTE
ncbi:hypothetical protein U14_01653 [Candidatus Moduliflexus flocculans]|uniref:Septum formation initiator n=1 Tax=Candidatus Moduliflexus flocculans TaxID=1499966 RepID=A0A0S6VYJ2_9BACT|nr:hypothetical protein U14_01653 [Candidatus Moduliflexus flocculans]